MARSRNGIQDRRGFDSILQGLLVLMPASLIVMVLYSWKIGLALLMASAAGFILMEAVSAPPANSPRSFLQWLREQSGGVKRSPILVCLGDSLTHGTLSSSYTPDVPRVLADKLGLEPPSLTATFTEPLWVVNGGQNGATAHTLLHERRIELALRCQPDYVVLFIGSNDVRAMYKPKSWGKGVVQVNGLPQLPTLETLEQHLRGMIQYIQENSSLTTIGVCTLPPLGEDLKTPANDWIRKANVVIEKTVNSFNEKCSLVPVYDRFESILEKKPAKSKGLSVDNYFTAIAWMSAVYYLLPGVMSWNALSKVFGHILLLDGLHLNDDGKDAVVDVIVEWLLTNNVAKAIAVKGL